MKTKIFLTWILGIALIAGCAEGDKFDYDKKVIYVTGADVDPLVKFPVENTPAVYTVTASATDKVTEKTVVTFEHNAALVAEYNEANKTSYYPIPASAIQIDGTQGVIEAGQAASSGITVRVVSTTDFKEGQIYMIPITIAKVEGGTMDVLNPSKTIYLRISRTVGFPSLDISNYNVNSNFIFTDDKAMPLTNGFTYEIKCFVDQWHPSASPGYQISRLCQFTSKNEQNSSMLRFGEDGNTIDALQWITPAGGVFSNTKFNVQQWYLISLVYDGSKFVMYVDGVKDTELAGTVNSDNETSFQRFEIGMSWASTYRQRQRFLGRVAEARVWSRALSASEIQMGVCGVDPATPGLKAYWKFNEGTGYIFHDATGNGYDMDWSNTWRAPGEGDIEAIDLHQYVVWAEDDKNKCNL
jgi:hypothetical protein